MAAALLAQAACSHSMQILPKVEEKILLKADPAQSGQASATQPGLPEGKVWHLQRRLLQAHQVAVQLRIALLQNGVQQAQGLCGGGQIRAGAVAQVAASQRAQQAVRGQLPTHKEQHCCNVVQALVVKNAAGVARHHAVQHAAQRGALALPVLLAPACRGGEGKAGQGKMVELVLVCATGGTASGLPQLCSTAPVQQPCMNACMPGRHSIPRHTVNANCTAAAAPITFCEGPQRARHVALHHMAVLVGAAVPLLILLLLLPLHPLLLGLTRGPRHLHTQQQGPHPGTQLQGMSHDPKAVRSH